MLVDTDGVVWHDYIGVGVPQSYFIDAQGIVRAFSIGPFSEVRPAGGPGQASCRPRATPTGELT